MFGRIANEGAADVKALIEDLELSKAQTVEGFADQFELKHSLLV